LAELRSRDARNFPGRLCALKKQYTQGMSQTADVLIVGNGLHKGHDFGVDQVTDYAAAKRYLKNRKPSVLVFGGQNSKGFSLFCQWVMENSPNSLWIVACQDLPPSQIVHWNNFGRMHDVIDALDDRELEAKLRSALESAGTQAQERKLVELFAEQSRQLTRLSVDLENRVERRQKTLRRSLSTLEETKTRLESFHKALLGIHRASSVVQMEQTLSEALKDSVNMIWVRVRFESQSLLKQQVGSNVLNIEIPFPHENLRGEVFFSKAEGGFFSPPEIDFLQELTEALGLALSRLHKLEQAETVKAQWQATFDAIPHPLCLTSENGEVLKLNRAFQQASNAQDFRALIGKKWLEVFFGKTFCAPVPTTGAFTFRSARTIGDETEHYEVAGQTLGLAVDGQFAQLILLRSISEEMRFERRILEASKLAELGTIGSSIAHELNNPLGGMLSFLQLILMDLKPTDAIYPEIKEMESAVLRCRDIVLNLLSFSRKQDLGEFAVIDLWDVIRRAAKLIALQSKSMGIAVEFNPGEPLFIHGAVNALSQALCNLLQNSIDAIAEKLKQDPLYPGRIQLAVESKEGQRILSVVDNGTGIRLENLSQIFNPRFSTRESPQRAGMGLTTAFTIVSEHHGTLEILSQTGAGTTAIISFPEHSNTP
jgi:two-component system, NtrC family, sensor kinase